MPADTQPHKPLRPSPQALAAARGRTIPDVLGPNLRLVFCGINPGVWSGATGHHFAHPSNRFWKVLVASGFTPERFTPDRDSELPSLGIGITNLVTRTTASAAELRPEELRDGAERLGKELTTRRIGSVAFLGVSAYRTAFKRPRAAVGAQNDTLGEARIWLLPNPSGLQAAYSFAEMAELFSELRMAVATDRA
jgi:double-stranded uracil-DNA glycosylase